MKCLKHKLFPNTSLHFWHIDVCMLSSRAPYMPKACQPVGGNSDDWKWLYPKHITPIFDDRTQWKDTHGLWKRCLYSGHVFKFQSFKGLFCHIHKNRHSISHSEMCLGPIPDYWNTKHSSRTHSFLGPQWHVFFSETFFWLGLGLIRLRNSSKNWTWFLSL